MDMIPGSALLAVPPALLAADTATLAAVAALHAHLMKTAFTPAPGTPFNAADEATFTGGAAKAAGTGAQTWFKDPSDNKWYVVLKEPAGGWIWKCTADPAAPEDQFGVIVTDNADAVVYGSQLLPNPVTISASGDAVDVGDIRLVMPNGGFEIDPAP